MVLIRCRMARSFRLVLTAVSDQRTVCNGLVEKVKDGIDQVRRIRGFATIGKKFDCC